MMKMRRGIVGVVLMVSVCANGPVAALPPAGASAPIDREQLEERLLDRLIAQARRAHGHQAWEAYRGIAGMGPRATRALPFLFDRVLDPTSTTAYDAAWTLHDLLSGTVPTLDGLQSTVALDRALGCFALGHLGHRAPAEVSLALEQAARDPERGVRLAAVQALAWAGRDESAGALAAALEDSDQAVRSMAANSLRLGGHRFRSAVPALTRTLAGGRVVYQALGALEAMGPDALEAAPEIFRLLDDPHFAHPDAAQDALTRILGRPVDVKHGNSFPERL